ncbi:MAG TPA: alpha-2-macroglobulin family protein [Chitinivibrionales bacterium]|nr:alpha-2-macroglobulin family protein [Chitinivibrionales bacterium]
MSLLKLHSGMVVVIGALLSFLCLSCSAGDKALVAANKEKFTRSWRTIDSLHNLGLTQSVLNAVDTVYKKAKAASNADQMIKAVIYRMRYESYKEEDAFVKALERLNGELSTAAFPAAPLLHSMLAECYWHYYENNRWRFSDRAQTEKFDLKDVRTWDLATIMGAMANEYDLSLKDADALKKTPLSLYDEVIAERSAGGRLRPTLYDFLAHRAVDFFSLDEGDLARPAFEFTLNSADYFKPFDEFTALPITSQDTGSLKLRAIRLLQGLIAFHANDNDCSALVDVDLKRLAFVRQHAVVPGKDSLYLKALERLEKRFSQSSASAEVTFHIASLYREWAATYQHRIAGQYRWMNKAALALCEKAVAAFPGSYGAGQCANLAGQIREKSMGFTCEYVNVPDKPFAALLQYKNVSKIYWRLVPIELERYQKMAERGYSTDSLARQLARLKPVKEWTLDVPEPGDYQQHSVELDVPAAPAGHYLVLAASDPEFKIAKQALCWATTQVSAISYIDRTVQDGGHEFYLLDRTLGSCLKGVTANMWVQIYDQQAREYKKVIKQTFLSDADGHISVPPQEKDYYGCSFEFKTGKDRLFLNENFSLYRYGKPSKRTVTVTHFFTDRAMYRPGQTIYFKGIMLHTDGEKNEAAAGENTTVRFYNVNRQEVAHLNLTSNDYGSVHGSFTAPSGTLNGQMYIADGHGSVYFSVEDYKRPRFEVTMNPFKGTKRLGETVRLEGIARAYAGSAVDGAKVKYRIVRQARFPNWWWCWWRPAQWSSEMEITNGYTVTNDTGGFSVDFSAIPDLAIPKTENPTFSYTGYFDVTDVTGETRSAVGSVNVGYVSLTLNVEVPQQVNREGSDTFNVSTANLNGTFEAAKGSIVVYKLKPPGKVYRARTWAMPDTQAMTKEKHGILFPSDLFTDELDVTAWTKGDKVFEKTFDTDREKKLTLKGLASWQQGAYVLEGTTADFAGQPVKDVRYFTLYSEKERGVPYPLADWFAPLKETCEPGEKASLLIGSGYEDVRVLFEVEHNEGIVGREWIKLSNGQKRIEIPIEEKHRGNLGYHLTFVRDNRSYRHDGTITVPWTNKMLDVSFETFRSKLAPGEKEEWRLKIAGKYKDKVAAEMVAALYDASLDAFRPHYWNFSVWPSFWPRLQWSIAKCFEAENAQLHADYWNEYPGSPYRYYPRLNWFGYNFEGSYYHRYGGRFGGGGFGRAMMKSSRMDAYEEQAYDAVPASAPAPEMEEKAKKEVSVNATPKTVMGLLAGSEAKDQKNAQEDKARSKEDLSQVAARTNLNETAFFYPLLSTDENGEIIVKFQIPEALTKWKMLGLAHTRDLKYGQCENTLVTQKDLMVMPNLPRFFRENDKITLTAKVSNMADKDIAGTAQLFLFNAATAKSADADFKNSAAQISFTAKKGRSAPLAWDLAVPEGVGAVTVRIVAKAGNFSDGEEQIVPVLSNRMLVTEAMPLPIRKKETKKFTFSKLVSQNNGSTTLRNYKLTLEFTSNPAWYAVQALPYMMEYPYECAEQTFARFYANSIAAFIANSSPRIKRVFDTWRTQQPEALLSNLEKNAELKSLVLEETPWLLDGKDESERKKRVALLFDLNKMGNERDRALSRLTKLQLSNGGWPWFEGMPDDRYITQYIAIGMGRLDHLGMITLRKDNSLWDMMRRCLRYLDDRIREDYEDMLRYGCCPDSNHLGETQIQYLYTRSYFKDVEISQNNMKAFDYYLGQSKKYWLRNRRYMQGMIALALNRYDDKTIPPKIMRSLKENSLVSEEMGMYWKEMYEGNGYWWWYEAPIESQALMVEAFDEVAHDTVSVEDLKAWLLKSKQTQNWQTTKATAEACYALLLRGAQWLSRPSTVSITLGDMKIDAARPDNTAPEAGTGYFKMSWSGGDVKPAMGNITVTKGEAGVAWGAVYWQYFEQLDKITPHETPLKINKTLFVEQNTPTGPKIAPVTTAALKPGDKIKVRIELRVDRDMEYVHMKDMRASGFEPLNVFSGYRWQDGLGYYESTRDAATNFFFGRLNKGTYVFEYPLVATHAGDFSNGITTIQCMYAPEFTSQSEGVRVKIGKER